MKKYFLENKYYIFMICFCNLIYIIAIAGMPFITKMLFDYDFSKGAMGCILIVVAYLFAAITGMIAQYYTQVFGWKVERDCKISLRHDLFKAICSSEYKEFSTQSVSHYVSLLDNDVDVVVKDYFFNVIEMTQQIVQVIVYAIYLFLLDYRIAIVIILASCCTVKVPQLTGVELSRRKKAHQLGIGNYIKVVNDLLLGFKAINHETRESIIKHQDETLEETEELMYHFGIYRAFDIVLRGGAMYLVNIVSYATLACLFLFKQITKGDGAAALQYISDFCYPVSYSLELYSTIRSTYAVKEHLISFMEQSQNRETKKTRIKFEKSIEFNNVLIKHDEFELGPLNLYFEKGKKYALIGHSGSGKSTILNVLMQYHSFEAGTILIDGNPLSEIDSTAIMLCLNQSEHLFSGGFLDNISVYQSYDTSQVSRIVEDSDCSRLNEVSQKLTCENLSGGEKQLVHLMKSLISQRPILLLDESFSALDIKTKAQMYELMYQLSNQLLITVTHDLSNDHLKQFDKVVLFNQGQIKIMNPSDAISVNFGM